MTDVLVGVCDLCGGDHPAGSCLQTSQLGIQGKAGGQHEAHLAYQSLPSWVEVQEGPGELQAVLRQQVPRMTRIGPLVAPHTPRLPQNTIFPLKICHEGGGQTFLDLSRKWLCNWLSLIPVGTPARHNLVACQIDDLIYYVSVENIPAGSGLLVWYAPFYQPKVQKELQEVGSPYSLLGAMVVTQKVSSGVQPSAKKPLVLAPTLARIVVGQGMVTFTHYNVQQGDADGFFTHQLLYLEDKYGTGILPPRCTQLPESPSALMIQGITHIKKYLLEGNTSELYNGQPSQVNIRPSIQLASVNEDLAGLECMVRLTVTAAEESGDDGDNEEELLGEDTAEEFYSDTNSAAEGTRIAHSSPISHQKRKYRHQNERKSVSVAGSDRVKQLPPRALGARDSRSWTCCYCSQTHSCLLTFTRHLKAHLLWLVGRCYVCQKCGLSLSSTELLQRHQQSAHLHNANSLPHTAEDEGATKSRKRKIWKSTASSDEEEGVDHSNKKDSYNSLKRIAALPTKPIEGPHTCQICTRIFDKPQYLLRHLRKHSGDFTCQSCLKVFARKESLVKHLCPEEGEGASLLCPVCGRSFLNPRLLEQHHLKHQGTKKCERCGWLVTSQEALKRHLSNCPPVQVTKCYQCELCGKELGTVKQLEVHQAHHRQQYHCPLCNKRYNNASYLARHIPLCRQSHQLSTLGRVACEDCGKEFTEATAFRMHHHTHTHPFSCSRCNHRFQTRVGFEVHVCEMEQQCDQCGTTFRSLQALNRHAAVHGPPPFSCKSCRRSYYRKESIERHTCSLEGEDSSQPKEDILYTCNVCGTQLGTRRSLNTHLRSVHGQSKGRLVSCEKCGKQFHRRDLLRQHEAVHAPPSLPCPTCHKLFKTPKSLEVHSLIHLNIMPFTCKYCNKKFHQKVNLVRHERSHLPRGTVKCQYCATHCRSTAELKAHLLSHTFSQEEQEDHLPDNPSLALAKKGICHNQVEEASEVLLSQFAQQPVVEPQLKFVPGNKSGLGDSQPLCGTGQVLADSPCLDGNDEGLKLVMKERSAPRLKTDVNKECSALVPGFKAKLVHGVVPVIASELTLQAAAVSHRDIAGQSTVFLPQRISNFSLAASETPLPSEYLVPATPPAHAPSPHHIGNSSVFKVTNDSINTVGCHLPSNVLITSATVPALDGAEGCHLDASKESHDMSEISEEMPVPSPSHARKVRPLSLSPGSACLYQPAPITNPEGTENAQVHDCHVLSGEQIVQSVVLVAEPPATDC